MRCSQNRFRQRLTISGWQSSLAAMSMSRIPCAA